MSAEQFHAVGGDEKGFHPNQSYAFNLIPICCTRRACSCATELKSLTQAA